MLHECRTLGCIAPVALVSALLWGLACHPRPMPAAGRSGAAPLVSVRVLEPEPAASASRPAPTAAAEGLPPLILHDSTPDTLFTWVDARGDLHVTAEILEIPTRFRDFVRVVLAEVPEGTGDWVYVADVRKKRDDGTYPVGSMPRAAWEAICAKRRHGPP